MNNFFSFDLVVSPSFKIFYNKRIEKCNRILNKIQIVNEPIR